MNQQAINLEIDDLKRQKQDVEKDIANYESTLRLADIATFLMLFVFLVGFYVSDPFHLASFIAEKFGGDQRIELTVYALLLFMAGIMSITISRVRRVIAVTAARARRCARRLAHSLTAYRTMGGV